MGVCFKLGLDFSELWLNLVSLRDFCSVKSVESLSEEDSHSILNPDDELREFGIFLSFKQFKHILSSSEVPSKNTGVMASPKSTSSSLQIAVS